jgi:hypothetical protein
MPKKSRSAMLALITAPSVGITIDLIPTFPLRPDIPPIRIRRVGPHKRPARELRCSLSPGQRSGPSHPQTQHGQ